VFPVFNSDLSTLNIFLFPFWKCRLFYIFKKVFPVPVFKIQFSLELRRRVLPAPASEMSSLENI
jgi:hypothetical protein